MNYDIDPTHRNRTIYRRSVQRYVALGLWSVLFGRDLYTVIGQATRQSVPVTCNRQTNIMRLPITVQYIVQSIKITIGTLIVFFFWFACSDNGTPFRVFRSQLPQTSGTNRFSFVRPRCIVCSCSHAKLVTFPPVMVIKPKRLYRPSFVIYFPRNRHVPFCIINVPLIYLFFLRP